MSDPFKSSKRPGSVDEDVVSLGALSDGVSDSHRSSSLVIPTKESESPRYVRFTMQELSADSSFRGTQIHQDEPELEATITSDQNATPAYRPSVRPPMAILQLIHDNQVTSTTYPILKDRFRIGRLDGDLTVPFDLWISGKHAEIQRRKKGDSFCWMLLDLKSTNGTFIQTKEAYLQNGDELFLGQERYRFLVQDGEAGLSHITRGQGGQWWPKSNRFIVGKSTPDALRSFETDPYLDPFHCEIFKDAAGDWIVRDNRSRNGTWYRVDEAELLPECLFQLGEQRFCFTWDPSRPNR
jgi:pSer/pThr/pTyr-binding forkhead associated (FHA) protein